MVIVVALLALIAAVYALRPLLASTVVDAPAEPENADALSRKRLALEGILDLEEEREAGKLTDDDFEELRGVYEVEAVEALRALEASDVPPADPLEAEIAAVKERLRCPACGAARRPGTTCPSCGA